MWNHHLNELNWKNVYFVGRFYVNLFYFIIITVRKWLETSDRTIGDSQSTKLIPVECVEQLKNIYTFIRGYGVVLWINFC